MITEEEKNVMRDAFKFLSHYADPPHPSSPESAMWWECAASDLEVFNQRNNRHPLAAEVGIAIYTYLEEKSKNGHAV